MAKRITASAISEIKSSSEFAEFKASHDAEIGSAEDANSASVQTDYMIGQAVEKGDTVLLAAMAEQLGVKRGSAELTYRANVGRVAALPTTTALDKLRNIDLDAKKTVTGEKYFRGRLRKYLDMKSKEKGVRPSVVMDDLLKIGDMLKVWDEVESTLDPKNNRKETLIENYFMAGPSITKARKVIESGANFSGDLVIAKARAEEMKVELDKFLSIV